MCRRLILFVALLPALLTVSAVTQEDASKEDPIRKAVRSLSDALGEVEDDSQAVMLLENFLDGFPDTRYTASVLDAIVYYVRDEMGDHDKAIATVKAHLAKIEDPEHLKSSEVVLAGAYNAPRFKRELREQVKKLDSYGELSYHNYDTLIPAAFGAEDWDLALDLCGSASETVSPEAVKADYPEAPEETIKERSEARTVDLDVYKSWGLANTGKLDQAMSMFESAAGRVKFNYFGIPENKLYLYWGKALLMRGDNGRALDRLLPMALWAEDEDALEAVRKIHGAAKGSGQKFEDYLLDKRREQAKELEGFVAVDYEDTMRESDTLMGKATLVAFWFPT